jgi:ribokinase
MKKRELNFDPAQLRYHGIIGTGGIGSGKFFVLNGNHTLGREESRSGRFLDISDYCKQHIILHYIKILLGNYFRVIPVGKVGADDVGRLLLEEMKNTGFGTGLIGVDKDRSTLFSFCFSYPDGSGGNLTTDNSASSAVDRAYIDLSLNEIQRLGSKGIALAAPEVSLEARAELLMLARQNGLFTASSITSGEVVEEERYRIVENSDLIAINADEAAAVAGLTDEGQNRKYVFERAIEKLTRRNKNIIVSITAGRDGSWLWDGSSLHHFQALKTSVISTAGAGDAFLSGLLTGIALGLEPSESQQLATLVASHSVTSPDTINKLTDRVALKQLAAEQNIIFSNKLIKLLED